MKDLTRRDFGNISEQSFEEIKNYLEQFKLPIDPLDYHFEETEEALFNWLHSNTDETPMEIKDSLMPRSLINVLHITEGWIFWYM